jgi:hypothetical protein
MSIHTISQTRENKIRRKHFKKALPIQPVSTPLKLGIVHLVLCPMAKLIPSKVQTSPHMQRGAVLILGIE